MKIQYLSDLHLDFAPMLDLTNSEGADVLVLAGDLAEYPRGLDWLLRQAKQYKYVLYVLGNHEFYHNEYNDVLVGVREYCKNTNILFLHNETFYYNDVVFVGSTFWTDFRGKNPIAMLACQKGMNDYNCIRHKSVFNPRAGTFKITPEFILHKHEQAVEYVFETCKIWADKKVVVITHHAPSLQAYKNSPHRGDILNAGFASDYDRVIMNYPNIKAWIYGHLHDTHTYKIGETQLYINARGYKPYGEDKNFNLKACFEI